MRGLCRSETYRQVTGNPHTPADNGSSSVHDAESSLFRGYNLQNGSDIEYHGGNEETPSTTKVETQGISGKCAEETSRLCNSESISRDISGMPQDLR